MNKYILSVLGQDRPGIVALVARSLAAQGWNIEDITQTILQTEFAGIFLISSNNGNGTKGEKLQESLNKELEPLSLSARVKPVAEVCIDCFESQTEAFVVMANGPDKIGTISSIATVMEKFKCNITNLKTVRRKDIGPDYVIMIYELDVPKNQDLGQLRQALEEAGQQWDLQVSIQHHDIFENIHRV